MKIYKYNEAVAHIMPPHIIEPVITHANNVASHGRELARILGIKNIFEFTALNHDNGKAKEDFFQKITTGMQNGIVEHALSGGLSVLNMDSNPSYLKQLIAGVISSHHAGLPDDGKEKGQLEFRFSLATEPNLPLMDGSKNIYPLAIEEYESLKSRFGATSENENIFRYFLGKTLFSILCYADSMATEQFMDPIASTERQTTPYRIDECLNRFNQVYNEFIRGTNKKLAINKARTAYYEKVSQKMKMSSNTGEDIFTLRIQTGGGKTLTYIKAALEYAVKFKKKRVFIVIPYTSIIDQTAAILKEYVGEENILIHHGATSNMNHKEIMRERMLIETYDAPIILTTNVQFFETIYSNLRRKSQKLVSVFDSVVVFDEIHALPSDILSPCVEAIRWLNIFWKCAVIMSTATQPIFYDNEAPVKKLKAKHIINNKFFNTYTRVFDRVKSHYLGKINNQNLIQHMLKNEKSVLCIVNTTEHARHLYEDLIKLKLSYEIIHLSARIFPYDKLALIEEIKKKLKNKEKIIVISTQLVECGIDFSFPVVYRSITGFDSIVQAGGRCNREGELGYRRGIFYVFSPELKDYWHPIVTEEKPRSEAILQKYPHNFIKEDYIREYYIDYYDIRKGKESPFDKKRVFKKLQSSYFHMYKTISTNFNYISSANIQVIIPMTDEVKHVCKKLIQYYENRVEGKDAEKLNREDYKKLYPYMISINARLEYNKEENITRFDWSDGSLYYPIYLEDGDIEASQEDCLKNSKKPTYVILTKKGVQSEYDKKMGFRLPPH